MESTLGKLARLAQLPNTVAKLTTVSANYSNEPWPHRDTWPAVRRVIDAFGAERCVWGSAFPQVCGAGKTPLFAMPFYETGSGQT